MKKPMFTTGSMAGSQLFKLWKKRSADEIKLADTIKMAAAGFSVPGYDDVDISYFNDKSTLTKNRIISVVHEAILGFVILGLFMLLLMGRRMSALVLAGIPVTFMITFAVMKYHGITINIVSLFGMIMVLGMMVDFSIVIAENTHRYMELGIRRKLAIENGVSEIFWSVTVTLLCIVIAFMPLLLVPGLIGRFIKAIPVVIIATLIASWFFAMFILPYFLNIFLGESHKKGRDMREVTLPQKLLAKIFGSRINKAIKAEQKEDVNYEEGLFGQVQKKYKGLITAALKHRYLVVGVLVVL
ncbi:MAG TPA: efflux RND transporter permease subunit, partial [Spirochaetota bacterium]|nr:efflux RND transporter permease subunit [Spirochaetota bacterium]